MCVGNTHTILQVFKMRHRVIRTLYILPAYIKYSYIDLEGSVSV
jgi:hypothetical protein